MVGYAGPPIRGLGAVKPHVKAAAEEIASKFQLYNIGGFATRGHVSNSDHYTGHALDVMTSGTSKGPMVAEWSIANAKRLSVKYVIWNRRIWQNGVWKDYKGSSAHTDHVHISFNTVAGDGSAPVDSFGGGTDTALPSGCLDALKALAGG